MNSGNTSLDNAKTSLKDEFCVWSEPYKHSLENEISEEYILPDYLPDIRKILLVKTRVEESDLFVEEGRVELGGEVVFNVVYLGDTGEVRCVSNSYPYSGFLNLENIYDESVINNSTMVKNRSCRAMSPRKLLLKAKAVSDVMFRNKKCVSPKIVGSSGIEDEFTIERSVNNIMTANYIQFNESDIRVSEDIEYMGKNPIGELIAYDSDVYTTECRYSDGRLSLKGMARLFCLVAEKSDDEIKNYEVVEKNIPISHTVDVKLPAGEWGCYAKIEMGAFECSVANNSYGESRVLEVDFVCRANITAMSNENSVFTDDVFSTAYEYKNDYKEVECERVVKCACQNFSASGISPLPANESGEYDKIFMSSAEANMDISEMNDGKVVFVGECNVKCVLKDTNNSYINTEFSFPLRFESPCEDVDNYRYMCDCNVLDLRVTFDNEKISANTEIGLNMSLLERVKANIVDSVFLDKSQSYNNTDENVMLLYYPERDENLWSVAKKYRVSRASLERANNTVLSDNLPNVIVIPSNLG